ncbi:hypothetical protein GCM10017608_04520 [Agromyces luteolus]|nr:hypothetical protein GCM10017608_04520 [Agromyces luteolus]
MTTNRITDEIAEALLRGRSPHGREDLSPLADAIAGFRDSSSGGSPRPSAAVALRLHVGHGAGLGLAPDEYPDEAAPAPARASSARRRVVVEWFAGLGLAAKISMGAVAAVALGASGAGAAGAAGMLPEPAQVVFDQVAGTQPGADRAGGTGADDVATDADDHEGREGHEGVEGGEGVDASTGLDDAEERAGSGLDTADEHADEDAESGLETADENVGSGIGTGEEASEGAGAPEGAGDQGEDAGSQSDDAGSQADDAGSRKGDRPGSDRDGD